MGEKGIAACSVASWADPHTVTFSRASELTPLKVEGLPVNPLPVIIPLKLGQYRRSPLSTGLATSSSSSPVPPGAIGVLKYRLSRAA